MTHTTQCSHVEGGYIRESCTSPIQYRMTSDTNNPLVSHCVWFTMTLKGMEPAPNPQ